ncbi:MAG: lysophospholipid acyltransferase family protein [bacterium]|nr:lysophospholipid acyltransferase family protein [bacterium]
MGINKDSRHGSVLIGIAARLARWVMLALGRTWKIEIVEGREHLDALLAEPRPVILSFWHNRAFTSSFFFFDLHRKGLLDITLLASQSRDGELVTRVFRRWGIHTVRGSASRGGRQALRAIHRAITRGGSSPIMIPDGPRGPLYQFKVGVAVLAQTSKAPILPFGFAARKYWTLGSWDRLIVPRPFTRLAVTIGEPQFVDRGLSSEELEAERQRLQELLDDLTRRAEASVGARTPV